METNLLGQFNGEDDRSLGVCVCTLMCFLFLHDVGIKLLEVCGLLE